MESLSKYRSSHLEALTKNSCSESVLKKLKDIPKEFIPDKVANPKSSTLLKASSSTVAL